MKGDSKNQILEIFHSGKGKSEKGPSGKDQILKRTIMERTNQKKGSPGKYKSGKVNLGRTNLKKCESGNYQYLRPEDNFGEKILFFFIF